MATSSRSAARILALRRLLGTPHRLEAGRLYGAEVGQADVVARDGLATAGSVCVSCVVFVIACPPPCVASALRLAPHMSRLLRAGAVPILAVQRLTLSPTSTQEVCMKRLIGLLIVLVASSVAWTDAHAVTFLNSTLTCDSDNDGTSGSPTDAKGKVVIMSNGTFKLTLSGVPAETQAECQFVCFINQIFGEFFSCGTANAAGKISFTLKEAIDPAALCAAPVVVVTLSTGGCFTGWGTGPVGPVK